MPLGKKLLEILSGGVVEKIGDIVDNNSYNKQERAEDAFKAKQWQDEIDFRNKELDAEIDFKEFEYLKEMNKLDTEDRDSARSREVEIAKASPDKIWGITTNLTSILALLTFVMLFTLILMNGFGAFEEPIDTDVYEDICLVIASFYFGSSIGSKLKSEKFEKLEK